MNRKKPEERSAESTQARGRNDQPAVMAGIGVGIGGLKSLKRLLPILPTGQHTGYILISHREVFGKDLTVGRLKKLTGLDVVEATDEMPVLADRLHVVSTDRFLNIRDGKLTMTAPVQCDGLWMPIDHFFCSLASDRGRHACGIVLSGDGSDGTLGLSEIKAEGGMTIVEDPKSTKDQGMAQSAIDSGVAGLVLTVEAMAGEIAKLAKLVKDEARKSLTLSAGLDPDLGAILDILRIKVGHDFRCYKPNTLIRRVHRRMSLARIESLPDYTRLLGENQDEVSRLQKDLQIGVTEFFRQPQAWETLEEKVIVPLIENAHPGSQIRLWVPGCSTGQEAYSVTMMLTEQARKSGKDLDIQVFATDSDITALSIARTGSYSKEDIGGGVPPGYLKRFFTRKDKRFQIIKAIREQIVFAPQNITADPPFSRLDLISCRNLLMYLEQQVQQKIFAIFHFALREGGFLFLGSAESIGERTELFEAVSKKWRIYRRIGVGRSLGIEIPVHPASSYQDPHVKIPVTPSAPRITLASTAQQVLMDRFAPACVMVDRKLQVLYVHGAIEDYLTFPTGELTMHVANMAREGLRTRLRGAISKCVETGRLVSINARVRRGSKSIPVKVTVSPLRYPRNADGLLLVTFEDQHLPATKLQRHAGEDSGIRQLEDELKITREELQSTIEQLESGNDQLKASNEEVTAANEELQAANEELETSKEELQSLNEELNTINTRLNEKLEELENTNNDVVNLLSSTAIATLFLDKKLRIKRFTPAIIGLFSLIPSDTGRLIADILRRFTDEALLGDARRVLTDLTPAAREVLADDGRWYMRRITPYRTQDDRIEGVVITFVDFTERKRAEDALNETRLRQAIILDSIADGFFAIDREWRFTHINDEALEHFRKTRDEVIGRTLFEVFPQSHGTIFEAKYREAMESGEPVHFEAESIVSDMIMETFAYPGAENLTVLFRDVTEKHRLADKLVESLEHAKSLARFPEENPNPVMRAALDGTILYCNRASAQKSGWDCKVGEPLPAALLPAFSEALSQQKEVQREIRVGEMFYGITVSPFPAESYANIYGRDITERKQQDEKLAGLSRLYLILSKVNEAIIRIRDDESLYQEVCRIVAEEGNFPLVWIGLAKDGEVIPTAACGRAADYLKEIKVEVQGELGRGPTGTSIRENRSVVNDDFAGSATMSPWFNAARKYKFRSSAAFPLRRRGEAIGAFTLYAQQPDAFDAGQVKLLESLSADISYALDFFELEKLRIQNEEALARSEQSVRRKLESILSPEGDIGNLELSDIIDVEAIRSMMVDFSALTDIAVAVIDLKGTVIVGESWRDICTKFHRVHPEACRHCIESDTQLTTGVPPGEARLYKCKNNMWDIATPIMVAGKHMGNVFTGQFFFDDEPVDYELFRAQARLYGFDEEAYIRALDAVPRLSREAVDKAISFLMKFAQTVSRLSYSNIKLARSLTERDTLMNSLRERERILQDVIDGSPSPIFLKDGDGKFITINKSLERMLGRSREEIKGKTDYDIVPKEVADYWRTSDKNVMATGKVIQIEEVADLRDGHHIFLANKFPLVDADGQVYGVGAISHDITERKLVEEALRESEERLRLFIEHAPASLAMFDREMRYLSVSRRWRVDYGLGEGDLTGISHYDVFPEITAQWKDAHRRGLAGEVLRAEADRFERADGCVQWVQWEIRPWYKAAGAVGGIIIFTEDITERKQAEEVLQRYQLLAEHTQDVVLFVQRSDGRILEANEAAVRSYGYTRDEILSLVISDLRIPGADMLSAAQMDEADKKGIIFETLHRRKDGSIFPVEVSSSGATIGDTRALISVVRNITDRKHAEDLLLKKSEQLEATNKELESFSYTVSHDLRAPLRAIDGYSRMILRMHADEFDDDALNKFNVIRKNTQMMGQLIDDLLAFSRLGRTQLTKAKLDMDALIREIWKDMIINETERRINFRTLELPPGLGDQGLIRQVLTNLLANAVKFTKVRPEAAIEAGGYIKNGESVYYVRDNGVGFDMEYYNKLFGVFQRLHSHEEYEGTGVGLAIVQRIINRHGGRVWAEAKENEGATFYFSLPA